MPDGSQPQRSSVGRTLLPIAALGVVFGDIGTSPIYALRQCLDPTRGFARTPENVLGVLSLIFWSLTLVVSVKYLSVIMRASNHGEGGILALLALLPGRLRRSETGHLRGVALLVIAGAGLLYGDGLITPAISVLSAVEGLEVAAPHLRIFVLPLTCGILAGLFAIQRRGTGRIGRLFGPLMLGWFLTVGFLGGRQVIRSPGVLRALNPAAAIRFFLAHGWRGFLILGAVVLVVTGAEALYADMGHFGARAIRLAWFAIVMPALTLGYLGQGAMVLAGQDSFFALVPTGPWRYGLVALATTATVIASQALIAGAFSLTQQAVQLGLFPRANITHTSDEQEGQIYVPSINWGLAFGCIGLVLLFRDSARLASAYGVAVTGTMSITSLVFYQVARTTWRWATWKPLLLVGLFLAFDLPFLASALFKFVNGGFIPVLIGAGLFAIMVVWNNGRQDYRRYLAERSPPLETFVAELRAGVVARLPGVGVFLTSGQTGGIPPALAQLVDRLRIAPRDLILLTVETLHRPRSEPDNLSCEEIGPQMHRIVARYGFREQPEVPKALEQASARFGVPPPSATISYFTERDTFMVSSTGRMSRVSETLFSLLARNARPLPDHFRLPSSDVIEIGSNVDLEVGPPRERTRNESPG
jgi:KUP system potassium uptake protein